MFLLTVRFIFYFYASVGEVLKYLLYNFILKMEKDVQSVSLH